MLALDLFEACSSKEISNAILLAGDDDFVPVAERAVACGAKIKLCYSPHSISFDLLKSCTDKIVISREILLSCLRIGY